MLHVGNYLHSARAAAQWAARPPEHLTAAANFGAKARRVRVEGLLPTGTC